ncbi:HNH endonuclease [Archangium minus]|uniref:HNH endonuclease n=1 Tax=Archangium minus TaxID=83450 RepID=A0ABY9WUE0_9BACT|nr:HNH endonuclease [Archangium minus]
MPMSVSGQEREALLHSYEEETRPLSTLKGLIKSCQTDLSRAECQYCCVSPPTTYDHYLPRSQYPEFAVHLRNLVPCCADCNRDRGNRWKNARGERKYVHLYDDHIDEDVEILFADIFVARTPSVTFRLDLGKARAQPFYQLLERHITGDLKLLAKYAQAAPSRLCELHQAIQQYGRDLSRPELIYSLREQLEQERELRGVHHWKVALLRAVIETNEFIEFALEMPLSVWDE